MKAIRFEGAGRPLNMETVPDPEPGPGWVVVDIEAAGLCHSDLHIMSGMDLGDLTVQTPLTLGHEGAGIISSVGEGVRDFVVGDRVGIALVTHPVEDALFAPGVGHDGAFAERELAHVSTLVRIPDNVTFAEAAVATDSVATAFHAVRTAGSVRRGRTVGVIGLGGLGLNGVRIAALLGATVYGVDINPATFGPAQDAGATACFQDVRRLAAQRPDVIVDFAGVASTVAAAVESVRPGGCVVLVGLGGAVAEISIAAMVMRNVRLVGSLGASKDELREVYELIASGALKPAVQEVPFAELPAAMDRLARGEVRGRLYTRPRAHLRVPAEVA
ncbi:zinc-binding dehydrogenase [Streptomyces sp. NPDC006530]|uniref:zinc-binding dehydrogenase n=1 Tax=Streptomyces sp. NPDC006530 TaxID=3364750 RepID=UPI0036A320DF